MWELHHVKVKLRVFSILPGANSDIPILPSFSREISYDPDSGLEVPKMPFLLFFRANTVRRGELCTTRKKGEVLRRYTSATSPATGELERRFNRRNTRILTSLFASPISISSCPPAGFRRHDWGRVHKGGDLKCIRRYFGSSTFWVPPRLPPPACNRRIDRLSFGWRRGRVWKAPARKYTHTHD